MITYGAIMNRLQTETAVVTFVKKDNSVRYMLCTRNLTTAKIDYGYLGGLLDGHDKRCNIRNGNIATIDLALGECRAFNVSRLLDIKWLGIVWTPEELEKAYEEFEAVKNAASDETTDLGSLIKKFRDGMTFDGI